MAKRKARKIRRSPVQAQLMAMRRELAAIRAIVRANAETVRANADAMHQFQRAADANMRRCAELQAELDRIKKLLAA
jgi:hypothetical protein